MELLVSHYQIEIKMKRQQDISTSSNIHTFNTGLSNKQNQFLISLSQYDKLCSTFEAILALKLECAFE